MGSCQDEVKVTGRICLRHDELRPKTGLVQIASESCVVHRGRISDDLGDGQYGFFGRFHELIVQRALYCL